MRAKSLWAVLISLVVTLGLAAVGPSGPASARSTALTFQVSARVQAGTAVTVEYAVSGSGAHQLRVQRQFGTSKVFKQIAVLPIRRALTKTTVPAPPNLGRYVYRLQALDSAGRVLVSRSRTVTAYQTLQLASLLKVGTTTATVGSREFRYAWADSLQTPDWCCADVSATVIKRVDSSCRWIDLQAGNNELDGSPQYGFVVTQENADQITKSFANATITDTGHLALASGGFRVVARSTGGSGYSRVYVNGTANCWTTNGSVP